MQKNLFFTCPHSGELFPPEAFWLKELDEVTLMYDVDRFVDELYEKSVLSYGWEFIKNPWHRYAGDPNRTLDDVDQSQLVGASLPENTFKNGFFWKQTSAGAPLLPRALNQSEFDGLFKNVYFPFHEKIKKVYSDWKSKSAKDIYQIDLHSMPSSGTDIHKDPGQKRAEIVLSDSMGKSCSAEFMALVEEVFLSHHFEVKKNFPYVGGGITKTYGRPDKGQHCLQIELRRDLYMNEKTKQKSELFKPTQKKLALVIEDVSKEFKARGLYVEV